MRKKRTKFSFHAVVGAGVCYQALPSPWLKHSFSHVSKSIEGWISPSGGGSWLKRAAFLKVPGYGSYSDWIRWGYQCLVLLPQLCNSAGPSQLWSSLRKSPVAFVVTASLLHFSLCSILLCLPPQ